MRALLESIAGDRLVLVNGAATFLLFILLMLIRWAIVRAVQRASFGSAEVKRRWLIVARNATVMAFLLFAGMIWAAELRAFALSIVAVAAAVVIATKEIILCFMGGIYRTSANLFEIGDRIEVAGVRGDVIDVSLMATTVLEIGPGETTHLQTGRAITIPNAVFLSTAVTNETYTDAYVLHMFTVPVRATAWREAKEALLDASRSICAEYLEQAKLHFAELGRKHSIDTPSVEPRVSIDVTSKDEATLIVRVPTPARSKERIEQMILGLFLEKIDLS
jgi:small-conductance mechanosensitive channel